MLDFLFSDPLDTAAVSILIAVGPRPTSDNDNNDNNDTLLDTHVSQSEEIRAFPSHPYFFSSKYFNSDASCYFVPISFKSDEGIISH